MGDIDLAEKMIIAAKKSGATHAKFQNWKLSKLKDGPWDTDGRREIYKKAELSNEKTKKIYDLFKLKVKTLKDPSEDFFSSFNENTARLGTGRFGVVFKSSIKKISGDYINGL